MDDDECRQLLLLFAADPEADPAGETVELLEVATNPESARRLTCPRERRARYRQAG